VYIFVCAVKFLVAVDFSLNDMYLRFTVFSFSVVRRSDFFTCTYVMGDLVY